MKNGTTPTGPTSPRTTTTVRRRLGLDAEPLSYSRVWPIVEALTDDDAAHLIPLLRERWPGASWSFALVGGLVDLFVTNGGTASVGLSDVRAMRDAIADLIDEGELCQSETPEPAKRTMSRGSLMARVARGNTDSQIARAPRIYSVHLPLRVVDGSS